MYHQITIWSVFANLLNGNSVVNIETVNIDLFSKSDWIAIWWTTNLLNCHLADYTPTETQTEPELFRMHYLSTLLSTWVGERSQADPPVLYNTWDILHKSTYTETTTLHKLQHEFFFVKFQLKRFFVVFFLNILLFFGLVAYGYSP